MAYIQYLIINGDKLPLPDSYSVSSSAVEADTSGETEAGTKQRDVIRQGVVGINVAFSVSPVWLKKLTEYSEQDKLTVQYFNTKRLDLEEAEMYITDFKSDLAHDTSFKGLWTVSLKLNSF